MNAPEGRPPASFTQALSGPVHTTQFLNKIFSSLNSSGILADNHHGILITKSFKSEKRHCRAPKATKSKITHEECLGASAVVQSRRAKSTVLFLAHDLLLPALKSIIISLMLFKNVSVQ